MKEYTLMAYKFDILNHDGFLISGGSRCTKSENLVHALKQYLKFGDSIISDQPKPELFGL